MSPTLERKCPQEVLQIKQKRSREGGKLRSLLDMVKKKLEIAGQDKQGVRIYVTAPITVDEVPEVEEPALLTYCLLQPKAKSAPPQESALPGSGRNNSAQGRPGLGQGWVDQAHRPL